MIKCFYVLLFLALSFGAPEARANSYLEMITTAPSEYNSESEKNSFFDEPTDVADERPPLWYDARITTASPVVFSPYPKYLAWQRAKAKENEMEFDPHEFIQNLIYTTEGGLAAYGLYQIYKYH